MWASCPQAFMCTCTHVESATHLFTIAELQTAVPGVAVIYDPPCAWIEKGGMRRVDVEDGRNK